jgi:hypothetical protein
MEKKYPIGLEEQANAVYQQYCTNEGIVYHVMDAANFCLGYLAAPTGAVWVKDRIKDLQKHLIDLADAEQNEHEKNVINHRIGDLHVAIQVINKYAVYLDESGSSDAVSRLQAINLTDIDAPIFTHTKEFAAHFSYIKRKMIDILKR